MAKAKDVKESNVISRWGILVDGQAGKEDRFFQLVRDKLKERGWPFPVENVEVLTAGFVGKGKTYLETKSGKLLAYVGAESFGKDAYLSWNLALADPGLFAKAIAIAGNFSVAVFQELSFNEVNSARAFASSLNYAVQAAVDAIMDDAGLDKSKVDREAGGILGRLI